jgi:hypothetical protein
VFDSLVDELERVVDNLDIPVDGAALARVIGLLGRLEAKVTVAVAEFDAAKLWDLDAEVSMTGWLRERAQMSNRAASRMVACGRRVAGLSGTAAAWQEGGLSSGQVEAINGVLNGRAASRFGEEEARLLPQLEGLSAVETANMVRSWRASLDEEDLDGSDGVDRDEPERSLHLSCTFGGQWRLDGDLDAESGQLVHTAVRLAQTADVDGEPARTPGTRRADAIVDICKFFLDHQTGISGGRHRPHLNVVVGIDDLARGRGGTFAGGDGVLDGPSTSALLCDGALHRVVTSGSAILDYGTTTRTIPAPLWNALVVRDGHCRFPGCDRPPWWCDGHHVVHVEHGGATKLDNLVLGCRRHHRMLHRPGCHAKLLPDATLEVTYPDGTTRTSRPPGALC